MYNKYRKRKTEEIKKMTINNMPKDTTEKYIVARRVNGDLWFWGAWNDRNKANEVAIEIHGEVIEND